MQVWSENPLVLLQSPLELVYSPHYSAVRNTNAMARFVIFWTVFSFAITKRYAIIFIGMLLLFFMRGTSSTAPEGLLDTQDASNIKYCEAPSVNNPLGNPLLSDFGGGQKLPACPSSTVREEIRDALNSQPITGQIFDSAHDDSSSRLARRQFYTVPSSTVPNERDAFTHALFGSNLDRQTTHQFS